MDSEERTEEHTLGLLTPLPVYDFPNIEVWIYDGTTRIHAWGEKPKDVLFLNSVDSSYTK